MKYSLKNDNARRSPARLLSLSFGALAMVSSACMAASESIVLDEVPEGFKRLFDGSLIVNDRLLATPPEGFYIDEDGVLKKHGSSAQITAPRGAKTQASAKPTQATASVELTEPPPGFHRMPDGRFMANQPSKAVAPPGYVLAANGVLEKADGGSSETTAKRATVDDFAEVPPGYHVMSDGTLMANFPSKAVAPPGYRVMPDGTLMPVGASGGETIAPIQTGGGMWMFEYEYQRMEMADMLDQTTEVTAEQAVDPAGPYGFMMAPTTMTMDMHMLMLMYHTRSYMLMLMGHYMSNEMGMLSSDGTRSTMESSGIADTIFTATFPIPWNLSFMVGMSFPTGDIDVRGPMTHSAAFTEDDVKYPYGMQLGSGTYDLLHGFGYEKGFDGQRHILAAKYEYTLRLGENDNNYTWGDKLLIDGSWKWNITSTVSTKLKLQARMQDGIEGFDPEIQQNIAMSPTADARAYSGRRVDASFGVRYETPGMTSVGLAYSLPVYQDLSGLQMKTDSILTLTAGFMF